MVTQGNPAVSEPLPGAQEPATLPPPGAEQSSPPAGLPPDVLQLQARAERAAQLEQHLIAQQNQMAQVQTQAMIQGQQGMEADAMGWAAQQTRAAVPQMVAQGWDQDKAEIAAAAHYRGEAHRLIREFQQGQQVQEQKAYAVQELSRLTGMPPAMLSGFNDWNSMVSAARQYMQTVGPQQWQLRQLQQRVQQLAQGQVPAQNYAQPAAMAGRVAPNTDNIDALYMGWENAHGGAPGNPYEAQYRRFLNM